MKKRVTSFDVAKLAGVSRSVVSAVINGTPGIGVSDETREAVLAAMRELNYQVDAHARGMKTGRSGCIAAFGDTGNPLFLQLLEGMQRAALERGYQILLVGREGRPNARSGMLDLFLQRRIDGIISLDETDYNDEEWASLIARHGIPFVSVEGYAERADVASVLADYGGSITAAMRYLTDRHGGAPVYVELTADGSETNWAERHRREAYMRFCREQRLEAATVTISGSGEAALERLLRQRMAKRARPVFLTNWVYGAIGLYRAARHAGLQPGRDLYVMSADNTLRVNRYLDPILSGMDIPYARMGEAAVGKLLEQIGGPAAPASGSVQQPPDGASAGRIAEAGQPASAGANKIWLAAELVPGESG